MPSPTPRDVHVDAALTNISIAYKQSDDAFVAEKVFPVVPVGKQSGTQMFGLDMYMVVPLN